MLKKWIVTLIPVALIGLSGCASTNDSDTDSAVASNVDKKMAKDCDKVRPTGSSINRCKK